MSQVILDLQRWVHIDKQVHSKVRRFLPRDSQQTADSLVQALPLMGNVTIRMLVVTALSPISPRSQTQGQDRLQVAHLWKVDLTAAMRTRGMGTKARDLGLGSHDTTARSH
jgi:hypothetical protein